MSKELEKAQQRLARAELALDRAAKECFRTREAEGVAWREYNIAVANLATIKGARGQ